MTGEPTNRPQNQADFLLINKFLDDQLTDNDKVLLKKRFDEDLAFANELKLYTDIEIAAGRFKSETKTNEHPGIIKFVQQYKVAAIIVLFVGLGAYFLSQSRVFNGSSAFYAENREMLLQSYELPEPRSKGEIAEARAKHFYETAQYDSAAWYYTQVVKHDSTDRAAILSAGVAWFHAGNDKMAESYLRQIRFSDGKNFASTAQWFIAWIYIKRKNYDAAANIFDVIAKDNKFNQYQKRSQQVLATMRKKGLINW